MYKQYYVTIDGIDCKESKNLDSAIKRGILLYNKYPNKNIGIRISKIIRKELPNKVFTERVYTHQPLYFYV